MKIRTKLLLALAMISLFPSIAAYVALIGNPGIAFSLRMNDYEAEQGLTAQRLQTDLYAALSDAEESQYESYQMQFDPRGHDGIDHQRRLANTALRSQIETYGTDLASTTLSE